MSVTADLSIKPQSAISRRIKLAILIPVVIFITAIAHWPALSAKALWLDDNQYLIDNPLVQRPSGASAWRFLSEVFTPSTVQGYYQPLTMISLMLDVAMGGSGDHLVTFHRTSLILHVANTALIILFIYLLFGQPWIAALTGLLFGLHPLTVEPIPWIGERKTLLASFFALLAFIAYVRYTGARGEGRVARAKEHSTQHSALATKPWFWISVFCYFLALMSKPTTTPLPLLLLLIDYWPLNRLSRQSVREKAPFFALSVLFAMVTIFSQGRTAGVTLPQQYPPQMIPLVLCHNVVFYLHKIVWPVRLVPYYMATTPFDLTNSAWLGGVIGTALLFGVLAISWRWTRVLVTSWLFFFIAIFPTMGVIGFTSVIASDKYAYLPAVGLLPAIAWGMSRLWMRWPSARRPLIVVLVVLAAAEFRLTRRAHEKWQDTLTLFNRVLEAAPKAGMVHNNLGNLLLRQGQIESAMQHYRLAMQHSPDYEQSFHNYGRALADKGDAKEAIRYYEQALKIKPDYPSAQLNLANAFYDIGQIKESIETYRELLAEHPDHAAAHHNLANVLSTTGHVDEAIAHYERALTLQPVYAEAEVNFGNVLIKKGRSEEAIQHLNEGLRLRPDWYFAHYCYAGAMVAQGKPDVAIDAYREAIRLNPDYALAHNDLGTALVRQGDIDGGIVELREAVRLDPKYINALFNLATMLLQKGQNDEAVHFYKDVLSLQPKHPIAQNNLGAALERLGQFEEAIQHYDLAIQQKPDYLDAHYNKGLALERIGRMEHAIAAYEDALEIDPNHPEIQAALDAVRSKRDNAATQSAPAS